MTLQKILDHAVDWWPVADFVRRGAFCCEERTVARFGFVRLMLGAGDVDPVPALPFSGRYGRRPHSLCVLDGGSAVAEHLGDADLVEGDVNSNRKVVRTRYDAANCWPVLPASLAPPRSPARGQPGLALTSVGTVLPQLCRPPPTR
jgi:hypothetical protein